MACRPREEMLMHGIHQEEVVLAGALFEVGVADVGFYGGGYCDLGMEEEEETKCAELGVKLEPTPAGRYLLMEQRPMIVDAWARRMKRCRFHHFARTPRSLHRLRQK
jgi:hypothetical protein